MSPGTELTHPYQFPLTPRLIVKFAMSEVNARVLEVYFARHLGKCAQGLVRLPLCLGWFIVDYSIVVSTITIFLGRHGDVEST